MNSPKNIFTNLVQNIFYFPIFRQNDYYNSSLIISNNNKISDLTYNLNDLESGLFYLKYDIYNEDIEIGDYLNNNYKVNLDNNK
jgi:hypothetical protein